jgi:hypothetical protein
MIKNRFYHTITYLKGCLMRKNCFLFLLLLLVAQGSSMAASRFLLQTELRTNYNGGVSGQFYTGYSYDESGNRVQKRVFDGIDSTAVLMSREVLSYDAFGNITQVLLLSATGDTLSIVRNTYGANGLESAATINKNGTTRFIDSLFYSGGIVVEQSRTNATGTKMFLHRYSYTGALLNADSLFEPDGASGFIPTQARLVSYNNDNTVAQEVQWRKSGTSWYAVGTTKMAYSQNLLLAAALYETDGVSGVLTDSLAYLYDTNGNRIKESHYDNERMLTYDIAYTWTGKVNVIVAGRISSAHPRVLYRDGRIVFSTPFSGMITLCSMNGRTVSRIHVENSKHAIISCQHASGRYVAMLDGTIKQTFPITINN